MLTFKSNKITGKVISIVLALVMVLPAAAILAPFAGAATKTVYEYSDYTPGVETVTEKIISDTAYSPRNSGQYVADGDYILYNKDGRDTYLGEGYYNNSTTASNTNKNRGLYGTTDKNKALVVHIAVSNVNNNYYYVSYNANGTENYLYLGGSNSASETRWSTSQTANAIVVSNNYSGRVGFKRTAATQYLDAFGANQFGVYSQDLANANHRFYLYPVTYVTSNFATIENGEYVVYAEGRGNVYITGGNRTDGQGGINGSNTRDDACLVTFTKASHAGEYYVTRVENGTTMYLKIDSRLVREGASWTSTKTSVYAINKGNGAINLTNSGLAYNLDAFTEDCFGTYTGDNGGTAENQLIHLLKRTATEVEVYDFKKIGDTEEYAALSALNQTYHVSPDDKASDIISENLFIVVKEGEDGEETTIEWNDPNITYSVAAMDGQPEGSATYTIRYRGIALGKVNLICDRKAAAVKSEDVMASKTVDWKAIVDKDSGVKIYEYTEEAMKPGYNYIIGGFNSGKSTILNATATPTDASAEYHENGGATGYVDENGNPYTASNAYFTSDSTTDACLYHIANNTNLVTSEGKYLKSDNNGNLTVRQRQNEGTAFTFSADRIAVSTKYMRFNNNMFAVNSTDARIRVYREKVLYPETTNGFAALSMYQPAYSIAKDSTFTIDKIMNDVKILYKANENAEPAEISWDDADVEYHWDKALNTSEYGLYTLSVSYKGIDLGDITVNVERSFPEAGSVQLKKESEGIDFAKTGVAKVELDVDAVPPYFRKSVDVVFITDVSNSMAWKAGTATDTNTKSEQKLGMMEDAVCEFTDTILADNEGSTMENNNTITFCTFGGTPKKAAERGNVNPQRTLITASPSASTVKATVRNVNMGYELNSKGNPEYWIRFDGSTGSGSNVVSMGGTDYDSAFEEGKNAITEIKNKYRQETGVSYDSSDRQLLVIFVTDGAPQTYNIERGSNQQKWYNYISTNTHNGATDLVNNYGVDQMDVVGIDFENGGFTVGGVNWIFTEASGLPLSTVLKNMVSGRTLDLLLANDRTELAEALRTETQAVAALGSDVRVADKLGEAFRLQMAKTIKNLQNEEVVDLEDYNEEPSITLSKYPTVHLSDVDNVRYTANDIGTRLSEEPEILEKITFNDAGTEAYSSILGDKNILIDGVICGDKVYYNTTDEVKTVGDITIEPQSFHWNIVQFSEDELALSYYVYLDGAVDGNAETDAYDTNEYAKLSYTDIEKKPSTGTFPVPDIEWEQPALYPDIVVVDYGIPVAITITGNDTLLENGTITGIGSGLASGTQLNNVPYYESKLTGRANTLEMAHGTAVFADDKITYTPADMLADDADTIYYEFVTETGKYYYTSVTVIPAQNIYYEESFMTFTDGLGGLKWETPTNASAISALQAEDRPGKGSCDYDADNVYGFDEAYSADTATYSMGMAKVATVPANSFGKEPYATFDFCGTGFDIYSVTDSKSGCVWVQINNKATGKLIATRIVDAYYGYAYGRLYADENGEPTFESEGTTVCYQSPVEKGVRMTPTYIDINGSVTANIRYYSINSTPARVVTTQTETYYDADGKYTETPHYYDENGDITTTETEEPAYAYAYAYAYGWLSAVDEDAAIYQVPVLRERNLDYATYTVKIIPRYSAKFDEDGDGKSSFYVDGVRIYDPCGTSALITENNKTEVRDAYQADGEWNARYIELRNNIITAQNFFTAEATDARAHYALFIDGFSALNSYDSNNESDAMEKYLEAGPDNELYLANGQAVTFKLIVDSDQPISTLQLGMKIVEGNENGEANGELLIVSNTPRGLIEENSIFVNGSSPMYRDLTDYVGWVKTENGWETAVPLVMINVSDTVISLTNVKWGYDSDPERPAPKMMMSIGQDDLDYTKQVYNNAVYRAPDEIDLGDITAVWNDTNFELGASATLTVKTPATVTKLQVGDIEIRDYTVDEKGNRVWSYTVLVTENTENSSFDIVFTDEHGNTSKTFTTDPIVFYEEPVDEEAEGEAAADEGTQEAQETAKGFKALLQRLTALLERIKRLFASITGWWN